MQMLDHFLRISLNFGILHDRLDPGLRDAATALIFMDFSYLPYICCYGAQHHEADRY